jgi:YggT family protein
MFVLGYFLMAFARVLDVILFFFMIAIIARAILSWVSPDPYNPIVRFINNITEPLLYHIRRRLPVVFGGIDFSPVIVILMIMFIQEFLIKSLLRIAQTLL